MGIQPAQVDVRHLPLRKVQRDEDHIHDPRLQIRLTFRGDDLRFGIKQVYRHSHIMRPEAPERVLIVTDPAEVQTLAIQVERLADFPRRHQVLHLDDCGMIQEQVAHHETPTVLLGDTDQLLGLAGRERHGLLDQDMLAGFECPPCLVEVLRRE